LYIQDPPSREGMRPGDAGIVMEDEESGEGRVVRALTREARRKSDV
jgi:hypothetical protein